jgi:hypothetical protein
MKDLLRATHDLYGDCSQTPPSTDIYISGTLATSEQMTAITAKATKLETEWNAQEYSRNRAEAYDSVGNQLDMMMKDMRDGTKTHQAACEAVKAKYPK